jgi:ABC-type uncharacterized transport system permease subunit
MANLQFSKAVRGAAAAIGVLVLALLVVALVVRLLGGDPVKALLALHRGSIGTSGALTETLIKTTPLLFTGLSVAVAFRGGIWNIGAEGQFLAGMLGTTVAALLLPPLPPLVGIPVCLAAGAVFGALWAAGPAALKLLRDVPEVISTIMLNFLAVYVIEYLVRGPLHDPRSEIDQSPLLPEWSYLPRLGALLGTRAEGLPPLRLPNGQPVLALGIETLRLHVGVLLAVATLAVVWVWLARSRSGFRILATGFNPSAARAAGIPVARTIAGAFLLSGALAGLGGAVEVLGLIQRLYRYEPGSPGYGFSGIAVALLGRLHPAGVLAAALFFGALTVGSNAMQREAQVSVHVAEVVQAAVVLLLIALPRLRLPVKASARTADFQHAGPQTEGTEERNGVSDR